MKSAVTKEELKAGLMTLRAVAEAVRELKRVPEGTLYANLMQHMDLAAFTRLVDILISAGLVKREAHVLIWCGPEAK